MNYTSVVSVESILTKIHIRYSERQHKATNIRMDQYESNRFSKDNRLGIFNTKLSDLPMINADHLLWINISINTGT